MGALTIQATSAGRRDKVGRLPLVPLQVVGSLSAGPVQLLISTSTWP